MKFIQKPLVAFAASVLVLGAYAVQKIDSSKWQTFSSKEGSFKIKTPEGWSIGDPNDPNTKAALEKLKANNPKQAAIFENADKNQFDLYLVDFGGQMPGVNNMNLKTLKDSGLTQAMYGDVAKEVFKQAKMSNTGSKIVNLPAGKTLNYWGSLNMSLGDGQSIEMKVYGYLIVKGNMTYIATMTTTPQLDKETKLVFEEMAKTITLK